jgi:hypothetical protein
LSKSIAFRSSDIDQRLLLVNLRCPRFKFPLLGIDLDCEFVRLVYLSASTLYVYTPFKLSRTCSNSASSASSFFSKSATFFLLTSSSLSRLSKDALASERVCPSYHQLRLVNWTYVCDGFLELLLLSDEMFLLLRQGHLFLFEFLGILH